MNILGPYLIVLSPSEKQTLSTIGEGSLKFIEMSYKIAVDNPRLLPSFMETSVFGEKFSVVRELLKFAAKLNQLKENIRDTEIAADNCGLETAFAFYNMMKIAARRDIPGARVIFEELKPAFNSRKRMVRKTKTEKNKTQPELFDSCELLDIM